MTKPHETSQKIVEIPFLRIPPEVPEARGDRVLFNVISKRKRLGDDPAAVCAAPSDILSSDQLEDLLDNKVIGDGWPKVSLRSALKWLKPVLPAPPLRLQHEGKFLSQEESHQA